MPGSGQVTSTVIMPVSLGSEIRDSVLYGIKCHLNRFAFLSKVVSADSDTNLEVTRRSARFAFAVWPA